MIKKYLLNISNLQAKSLISEDDVIICLNVLNFSADNIAKNPNENGESFIENFAKNIKCL